MLTFFLATRDNCRSGGRRRNVKVCYRDSRTTRSRNAVHSGAIAIQGDTICAYVNRTKTHTWCKSSGFGYLAAEYIFGTAFVKVKDGTNILCAVAAPQNNIKYETTRTNITAISHVCFEIKLFGVRFILFVFI